MIEYIKVKKEYYAERTEHGMIFTEGRRSRQMEQKTWVKTLEPVLVIRDGMKNCGDEESVFLSTIELILQSVPKRLLRVKEALEKEDYDLYIRELHTLKSNAFLIGANPLGEEAKRLEYAGKAGEYGVLKVDTEEVLLQFEQLLEYLGLAVRESAMEQVGESDSISLEELEQCKEILQEAAGWLQKKDLELAANTVEILDIYEIPEEIQCLVAEVKEKIANENYESAYRQILEIEVLVETEADYR